MTDQNIIAAYNDFIKIPLRLLDANMENALMIACKYMIYAYDAYYLEVANRLNLPLLTLDESMKNVAVDMKVRILEVVK